MVPDSATPDDQKTQPRFQYSDMSVAQIEASLHGISYPATKQDLLRQGNLNKAPEIIMAFFKLLPEEKFKQFDDIAFMAWSLLIV